MRQIIQLTTAAAANRGIHVSERHNPAIHTGTICVVFIDASEHRRRPMLDLFYVVVGTAGFLALWAITKACERV